MSVSALYVQWADGWSFFDAIPSGRRRRERQFDIAAQSHGEVERVAQAVLAIFNDERSQITVVPDPKIDSERGYLGYTVGDTVTVPSADGTSAERIQSITGQWDVSSAGGHPSFAPTLKDVILEQQEAVFIEIERMARGALGGNSGSAGVLAPPTDNGSPVIEPFRQVWSVPNIIASASLSGGPWRPPTRLRALRVTVTYTTAVITSAILRKNGVDWIDLGGYPSGNGTAVTQCYEYAEVTDIITLFLNAGGATTGNVTVDMEYYPSPLA